MKKILPAAALILVTITCVLSAAHFPSPSIDSHRGEGEEEKPTCSAGKETPPDSNLTGTVISIHF